MIPLEQTVAVLLCAGLSQRYGPGNKLLALLDGKPLAMHAAALCARIPFYGRVAVVPPSEPTLYALLRDFDFDFVVNAKPAEGRDTSVRLGLARALDLGARGALVLLGDMPHVTDAHLRALSEAADEETAAISLAVTVMLPPTLMPAKTAKRVIAHTDQPVRASLGHLVPVAAPTSFLADYDYQEQFEAPPAHKDELSN